MAFSLGIPINRLLLANERTIGRAYSKDHFHWQERRIAKRALKNNMIGIEVIRRAFYFADKIIRSVKPDIILSAPTAGMDICVLFSK